jgi:hypothetical protein
MDEYLTQEELNNIFSRGVVPIVHSIPSELVTERNIISKPINLLQYYIDFDFSKQLTTIHEYTEKLSK